MEYFSYYEYFSNSNTEPVLFWHITHTNNSEHIIKRQYNKIKNENINNIYIGIINLEDSIPNFLNEIIKKHHILFIKKEGYECETMLKIWEFSKNNPNTYLGYIHTKGISHTDCDSNKVTVTKEVSPETSVGFLSKRQKIVCDPNRVTNCKDNKAVTSWAEFMEFCTIEKWKTSINYLKEGYDTVGCNLANDRGILIYQGNFWWANTNWISKNPHPFIKKTPNLSPRHECSEYWIINSRKDGKHKNLHKANVNQYEMEYPRNKYENTF